MYLFLYYWWSVGQHPSARRHSAPFGLRRKIHRKMPKIEKPEKRLNKLVPVGHRAGYFLFQIKSQNYPALSTAETTQQAAVKKEGVEPGPGPCRPHLFLSRVFTLTPLSHTLNFTLALPHYLAG